MQTICRLGIRYGARLGGTERRGIHLGEKIAARFCAILSLTVISSASCRMAPFNPASSHLINLRPESRALCWYV